MRRNLLTWSCVLLLFAAGVFFYLSQNHTSKNLKNAGPSGAQSAQVQSSAAAVTSGGAAKAAAASAKTNKFSWRLSNTTNSFSQLSQDPHAILLENAFIDTDSKLNLSIPKSLQAQGDPGAWLVQARGPISPAFRALLSAAGATVVSYIPNNSFLVRATEAVANGLIGNPLVQAVIPYEPYYKVQSPLLPMAEQPLPQNVQLNLGLFAGDASGTIQQIQQAGGIILSEESSAAGYIIVKVEPPSNWTSIAQLPGVHIVEPYYHRKLANDLARTTMKISANSVTTTNYLNLYGSNVMVEVNDSGIDTNHPDFRYGGGGAFRVNYQDPRLGVDINGHGTHVAGIIAGDGFKSSTVTNAYGSPMPGTNGQFRGKAPLAQMLSMNYLDSDQNLQAAAAETNALISNNSWGNGDSDYDLEAANYDAATRDSLPFVTGSQPVLYVFAAGDNIGGPVADTVSSPGTAKDVITVGALEEFRYITNQVTNVDGTVSQPWLPWTSDSNSVVFFSSDGNTGIGTEGTAGRFKPDLAAPGTFVVSTRSGQWDTNAYYHPTNNFYYDYPDLIPTNSVSLRSFPITIPSNTVDVIFYTVTNLSSPPTLPVMPIYLQTNNPTTPFGFIGTNYAVVVPAPQDLNENWSVVVSNVTDSPLAYDLIVDVQTTNWMGNYYQVLQGMNDSLGPPGNYYRYESGTSMSAPAVSGFLALIQDYFTNQFNPMFYPSPALLKAMVINGARPTVGYVPQVNSTINYEGWGLPDLSNSIPACITNVPIPGDIQGAGPSCSTFIRDQPSTQYTSRGGGVVTGTGGNGGTFQPNPGLATGDQETFMVNLNTNAFGNYLPLRVTLAWTDPPGDPTAAIKLVNNLELVVTDMVNQSVVYYGNDIGSTGFNNVESATNSPIVDVINNIQDVIIRPFSTNRVPDYKYSVTVKGYRVNVNAWSETPTNDVQDFALVISSGDMGQISNSIQSVTDEGIVSNPTGDQNITAAKTNTILLNQTVGANTPLLGTNIVDFTTNTITYGTNGQFTVGMTNQWHFYVVTNTTGLTNAAFITFGATTLSIPRMGVFADSVADSTTPGADLDLLVTRSSTDGNAAKLLTLDPIEVSNCINGVSGDGASLVSGGTDFVAYTNTGANPPEVFYIGVKSESHMAAEYDFVPIFTDVPFGSLDNNGNEYINGINVPVPIHDGTTAHPGLSFVFLLALYPIQIQNMVMTNIILHQNFGDLVGYVTHGGTSVVLNNHDSLVNPPGPYTFAYSSDPGQFIGTANADGPGTLASYQGASGQGIWQLTEEGTAIGQTGMVESSSIFLQKYQNPRNGFFITIQPGQWFYTFLDVPPGYTNLDLFGSLTNGEAPGIQMYLNTGGDPTATSYLLETNLVDPPPAPLPFPTFGGDWALLSYGPPLPSERYYIGLFNPNATAETVYVYALLNGPGAPPRPQLFTATNQVPIINDAVTTTNTSMFVSNTATIGSVNVGLVVQYPRISDLAFTLISPSGQRILLMENRGGPTATNAGGVFYITNSIGTVTANGSFEPQTNSYNLQNNSGSVSTLFNAYTIPDQLTIYYGNDPTTFNNTSGDQLFNSGMMSGTTNITVNFGPGTSTYVTFIVNQFGNTNVGGADAWTYTINGTFPSFNYLTFTDDTNLTVTPIKFAIPPFDLRDMGTNYTFGNLDLASNGDYFGLTNIYDAYGGWTVPTNLVAQTTNGVLYTNNYNEVSVVSDPAIAFGSNTNSSNFLALGYGIIQRTNFLDRNHLVTVSYQYRGPGIAGWWRGEGDARDSSDAEGRGQNGSLIGRFSFPAGEVSQAFSMENNGQEYDFAGTNGYVQIRQQPFLVQVITNGTTNAEGGALATLQSSYLDVGAGPGMTVEGWINPTNLSCQQPLVEWLARVPTNGSDTNLTIRAGPFLDRATAHYYYMLGATNWTTSETWAQELGGHLVTLDSADEGNWIFDTFASYGSKNRNLWIGLTNGIVAGTNEFAYSSGVTNVAYTNWLFLQPTNCSDPTRKYAFMFGITNQYAGLWALADNNGVMCGPDTNIMYGVVEVTNLQTNGVQFWISVTNVPGTTNLIMTNTGCLFANLVDTTNGSHWIYSGPNLIQSNVFQHVALTYDTNSGTAMLFYDGTNVATTNWGINIVPKTTGDVLLGKDMSLETNNYYGGLMDEMSIYNRALSDAEITAIYSVSAFTTNRLIGKFDPAVTPPLSLAEAQVVLGNMTNTILGENNTWQESAFTFFPQTNVFPMQVQGIEPGMLFDSFAVSEAPLGNLYYQPEQALNDELKGKTAQGNWTLEIWDTRLNSLVPPASLLSWQLQFILQTNGFGPLTIGAQEPTYVTIPPGQIVTLAVPVPIWAIDATNILLSSTEPLNVFYNTNGPPTGTVPPDSLLFGPATTGSAVVTTNNVPPPVPPPSNITPGGTYYIGLQNTGTHAAAAVFDVNFNITGLTNDVIYNDTLVTNDSYRYFSFNVTSTNAYEAIFQLLHMDGNADLVVSKGTLPSLTSSDYGSFNNGRANENIYVLTNSMPVPLSPGTWYLGVFNRDTHAVNYTVLAQELDMNPASVSTTNTVTLIQLTNGVPFNYTAGPGAALTNFFYFPVTNSVTITNGITVTNFVSSIHFELYNLSGNGDLTVQTNAPPFAPPFFQSSDEPGVTPEFIQITTNSALTNLAATWYLGVPNETTNEIRFTIIAVIDTNNYFPAFPGAGGAGAGALGASWRNGSTNNTVYHVTTLDDSGPGTLRDAVSSTNRTIIFDTSGVIYLESPLIITNSYLTIAGQTAPEGGITVAGASTIISTNVHDVVMRYIRFRPIYSGQYMYADGGNFIWKFTPTGVQSTFATLTASTDDLLTDANGDLYAAQVNNILKFTPGGVQSTFATGAGSATFMALNNSGSDLFESDHNGNIFEYTMGGVQSTFATGLNEPQGLVFNSAGDLIAAAKSFINEYTPGGAQFSFNASQVNNPIGIALNRAGYLFESDPGSGNILKFGPTGTPTTYASGVPNSVGLKFNNAGDLFVGSGNNVIEFNQNGTNRTFATLPNGLASVAFSPPVPGLAVGLGGDALQFNTVSNVIADHISALWSSNDDLSILNSTNVTVQWSILSDIISNQPAANGALVRYGSGPVSLHHNLFADNPTGNPRLGDNITLDFVNNVIYNWVTNAGYSTADDITNNPAGFTNCLNYICNYLIAGPNTITTNIAFWGGTNATWLFQTNNIIDTDTNTFLNGASSEWNMFTNWDGFTNLYTVTNQFRLPQTRVDEAYLAYERVLDFAGVSMFRREPAETNLIENVRRQSGGIITAPGLVPTLSTNLIFQYNAQDGIPDFWKLTFGQIVTNLYDNYQPDSSGYSELEEFDNWLAGPHALTKTNLAVGVDLQKLFGKTGSLSFWATNAVHGTVYLTNVLGTYTNQGVFSNSIAIFTPTNGAPGGTNYSGFASFDVFATNNDTLAWFPVTVNVFVSGIQPTYTEQAGFLPLYLPLTNSVPPYTTIWYLVSVPTNAVQATNTLLTAGAPVNLLYSSNQPPTTAYPSDFAFLTDSTNGSAVINPSGAPLPPELAPGGYYYLGVQNTNNFTTNYAIQVTFETVTLPPGGIIINPGQPIIIITPGTSSAGISGAATPGGGSGGSAVFTNNPAYLKIFVPPNAISATNSLASTGGPMDLWFNQNAFPLTGAPGDVELIANYTGPSPTNAILTLSGTPPLVPGQYYFLTLNNTSSATVTNVFEIDFGLYYTPPVLPPVTNITIVAGNTLNVNDQASDTNAGVLDYYLTTVPPVNATISNTGQITWAVPTNNPGENVLFTTVVSNAFTTMTATNEFTVTVIPVVSPGQPGQTNSVPTNGVSWIAVPVPVDADWATNILLYATNLPVNVLFTTNYPPTTSGAYTLMFNVTNGISILGTNTVPTNIVPGSVYYLGVQNPNSSPVNYAIQVNFGFYSPPSLPVVPNQTIIAGTTLTVTNTATDTNGVGQLFYTLTTVPPVDATISSGSPGGIITWATATNQAPGSYVFTTIVTNSATTLSATNTFTVTVVSPAVGQGPQTNTISPNSVSWMQVNVPANAEWATNILLFARTMPVNVLYTTNSSPALSNASVLILNQKSGTSVLYTNLSTAPTNLVPGGTYYLGVQNTNNFDVTYALQVIFGYPPPPLVLNVSILYTNISGSNGYLLTWYAPTNDYFQVQQTPSVSAPVWNTFTNIIAYNGPVTATNGLFSFFDNGAEYPFGPMRFYRLLLLQANALYLPNHSNYVISVSQPLIVTNTAVDSGTNVSLIYNLTDFPSPATNALISTNGIFTWTPGPADAGDAFTFTTSVSDNGLPPAFATNAFTVFVLPAPVVTSATTTDTNFTLVWTASKNDLFQVESTTNLVTGSWTLLPQVVSSSTGSFIFTDSSSPVAMRFYRLVWLPPP